MFWLLRDLHHPAFGYPVICLLRDSLHPACIYVNAIYLRSFSEPRYMAFFLSRGRLAPV